MIPKGIKFVMVAGDQELNQNGIFVSEDVRPNEFFKLKIKVKAPTHSRHYSAAFMLIDSQGYYFGEKVLLDVIVEEDTSESVMLAQMMDSSVDMNMLGADMNQPGFSGSLSARSERTSMMIHRNDTKPRFGAQPPPALAPPAPAMAPALAPVGQP